MRDTHEADAGPPREQESVAAAEAAMESEHERHLRAAREKTYAIADRLAKAAGYPGMLRPGKIVRLKSGSPPMTIAVVDIVDGLVYCHYFWRGGPGQARYSAEMLEPCEPWTPECFVPPAKPGIGDPWERDGAARAPRESPRGNPGRGERRTRARRNKTRKSKAIPKRAVRAEREPEREELATLDHKASIKAWRETMRRIARIKRLAKEREKRMRRGRARQPGRSTDRPLVSGDGPNAAPAAVPGAPIGATARQPDRELDTGAGAGSGGSETSPAGVGEAGEAV